MQLFNSPIISAQALYSKLNTPKLVILDASIPPIGGAELPQHRWPEICIGNAKRFDINNDFSDHRAHYPHTMLSAIDFERAVKNLAINNDSIIVVYDDLGLFSAARAWWMFKSMGHNNVHVLDGGLPSWLALDFPVSAYQEGPVTSGNFSAKYNKDAFTSTDQMIKAVKDNKTTIIDARSSDRFHGLVDEPRKGIRSGHIPTSKNLPFTDLMTNGCFKSKKQISALLLSLANTDQQLVMTCGSGVTACILALAADYCDYQLVSVYDGSWSEWGSREELPIE